MNKKRIDEVRLANYILDLYEEDNVLWSWSE